MMIRERIASVSGFIRSSLTSWLGGGKHLPDIQAESARVETLMTASDPSTLLMYIRHLNEMKGIFARGGKRMPIFALLFMLVGVFNAWGLGLQICRHEWVWVAWSAIMVTWMFGSMIGVRNAHARYRQAHDLYGDAAAYMEAILVHAKTLPNGIGNRAPHRPKTWNDERN